MSSSKQPILSIKLQSTTAGISVISIASAVLIISFYWYAYGNRDKERLLSDDEEDREGSEYSRKMRTVEVCLSDVESALNASKGGANSIEVCSNRPEGGITPSIGLVRQCVHVKKRHISFVSRYSFDACLSVPLSSLFSSSSSSSPIELSSTSTIQVHALIRPRAGDFNYTDEEFEVILQDILALRDIDGLDGIVIGILTPDGEVDVPRMTKVRRYSEGMLLTFHRAFDLCSNEDRALEEIIRIGCDRILTSGRCSNALEGADCLRRLVDRAAGRIAIIAAAGIKRVNVEEIIRKSNVDGVHTGSSVCRRVSVENRSVDSISASSCIGDKIERKRIVSNLDSKDSILGGGERRYFSQKDSSTDSTIRGLALASINRLKRKSEGDRGLKGEEFRNGFVEAKFETVDSVNNPLNHNKARMGHSFSTDGEESWDKAEAFLVEEFASTSFKAWKQ